MTEPIVITGVSGFVGRNLAKKLIQSGHEVVGLSRNDPEITGLNFIPVDLTKKSSLPTEFTASPVVHCAALTQDGFGLEFNEVNFIGTENALLLNPEGKFVHISSSSIYDMTKASNNVSEQEFNYGKYDFYNDYSSTKAHAETLFNGLASARTSAPVSLRPHGIYGEDDTTLLPRLMERINVGSITLPAGGKVYHSLTNIHNLIQAIELAIISEFTEFEAFNISDKKSVLISDAVKAAAQKPISITNIPTFIALKAAQKLKLVSEYEIRQIGYNRTYNIDKAIEQLGYQPQPFELDWL